MSENFRLCPFCQKGELRIHRRVVEGEATPPFRQKGESNQLICDMCNQVVHDNTMYERIAIYDSVSMKVTKAEEVERIKNNPRICKSCEQEKEIVYRDEKIKLCQECLDPFREQVKNRTI